MKLIDKYVGIKTIKVKSKCQGLLMQMKVQEHKTQKYKKRI